MNKYMLNFFISGLTSQTENAMKKQRPDLDYGKFLRLSFIVKSPTQVIQRMKFEKHESDKELTPEEIKKLSSSLSINLAKEFSTPNKEGKIVKSLFAIIDVVTKQISICYNYTDSTKYEFNL